MVFFHLDIVLFFTIHIIDLAMVSKFEILQPTPPRSKTGGFCRSCGKEHWLPHGNSLLLCQKLMEQFESFGTVDLLSTRPGTDKALETSYLFGPARGKMFGVMECMKPDGTTTFIQAFSGQYNGRWLVDGWAPPLFDVNEFLLLTTEVEKQIKELGREIDCSPPHSLDWLALRKKRRLLSRNLMKEIHTLYSLTNFRGDTVSLTDASIKGSGIPTGTGDCCAPKLLNFAARNKLQPLGMAEFYWGKEPRSGGHKHSSFSYSCTDKCQPILGFMLCGFDG